MCEDIPCAKVCPSGALDREIESIDDARMGLAVLVDRENCLNFQGLRCDVCYRECPKIDEAITPELERNTRTGKHARFLPTVHSDACTGCGKCEKSMRAGTTGNQGVTAVTGERGVRSPLPLRLAGGEQWQIVNVTPGARRWRKKGWWRSHRWLVLRRLCQFFVLGMFLSGPLFGVWILHGNYSSSLLFDTVPLTDPLMTLQSLASGHLPATVALTGAVIITVLYALAGKRLFCSWVCPLNPITDLANWLRRRFDLNQSATIPRHIRYVLLVVILLGSALTGTLIWEWINPVSLMGRSLVMGFGSGALLILALFFI